MGLAENTAEEKIWNFLYGKIHNAYGVAGLMGNLFAESGLNPKNLQNSFQDKLGHTDDSYTKAVDNGTYGNFVKDSAGYGLAQWTFWTRKRNLHDFAIHARKSIGDLDMQLDFLYKELSEGYKGVLSSLECAKSVREASDTVLTKFEDPNDQSIKVQEKRAGYGQEYYQKYAVKAEGGRPMTELQARQKIVGIMQGWIGKKESDGSHKEIIDIYNGHKPLARNYPVKYTDNWCATTVSAAAISAGYTDIIPLECSCGKLIELAIAMGIWQESDSYVPEPGDFVLYDWDDKANYATTDNQGWPEHIGMAEKVVGNNITFIEGNIKDAVGRRVIAVNGRYIRGYITPKYGSKATVGTGQKEQETSTSGVKVGDIVEFNGTKHYTSSYAGATGRNCKPGEAEVTAINAKGAHPYHLKAVSGKGSTVHGWVDKADVEGGSTGESVVNAEIKVGDIVNFSGNKHYTSSYATAKSRSCKGGKAKVTAINKKGAHPYHLKNLGNGCTVYGWTDAVDVSK